MKNYIFKKESDLAHYEAEALTLRCVDDRFWKVFKEFLKSKHYVHIDPKSPAGGLKVFASPEFETDREFFVREIEKSIKLHSIKRVMLFSHADCGAYGGRAKFNGNKDAEFAFHVEEHKKARRFLQEKFPAAFPIETYFIDESGVIDTGLV